MFLGLGVGAWQAAVLHFVTHAFFKSLLFLSAGAIILALDHQQDLFAMGGLRRRLPLVFWTFLVGAASMSALPPLSAGFSSKDWILYLTWSSPMGGVLFWALALAGVAVTSLYTFRMVFLAFFGPPHSEPQIRRCTALYVPLVVLAVPAALIGLIELPRTLGNVTLFSDFIGSCLPAPGGRLPPTGTEGILEIASEAASLIGLALAFLVFRRNVAFHGQAEVPGVGRFLAGGWGFDRLYDRLFVRPFRRVADKGREDILDVPFRALAGLTRRLHRLLSRTQTGQLRWYAFALALGLAAILALVVLR
jgi:NADH-quinone oxidoreductase subunit L